MLFDRTGLLIMPSTRHTIRIVLSILMSPVLACGGDQSTSPAITLTPIPTDFPITVSSGKTPTISWPGGSAQGIYIQEAPSAGGVTALEMWSFSAKDKKVGVASAVTYGTLPSTAFCDSPANVVFVPFVVGFAYGLQCPSAKALTPGTTYIIGVQRVDSRQGATYFTP